MQYAAIQWQIVAALGKLSDLAKNVPVLPGTPLTQGHAAETEGEKRH